MKGNRQTVCPEYPFNGLFRPIFRTEHRAERIIKHKHVRRVKVLRCWRGRVIIGQLWKNGINKAKVRELHAELPLENSSASRLAASRRIILCESDTVVGIDIGLLVRKQHRREVDGDGDPRAGSDQVPTTDVWRIQPRISGTG